MYNGSMLFNTVTPYFYAPLDVSVCHIATQDNVASNVARCHVNGKVGELNLFCLYYSILVKSPI